MTRLGPRVLLLLVVGAAACWSDTGDGAGDGADAGSGAEGPASCSWPAELDSTDASARDTCHAGRALLSCTRSDGVTLLCVSADGTACGAAQEGFEGVECESQCQPDEYVATCGGIGPGAVPSPPVGCRFLSANPGGVSYHCCPCS
jgi:hypothetical protein